MTDSANNKHQPKGFIPLTSAREFLESGRFKSAFDDCQRALRETPDHADAHYIVGVLAIEHNQPKRALQYLRRAVECGHPTAEPHVQAARCFVQLNEPAEALKRLETARSLGPKDGRSLAMIGALSSVMEQHETALEYNTLAVEASHADPVPWFNLASTRLMFGETEGARSAFEKALELDPSYLEARAQLALNLDHFSEEADINDAISVWNKANPEDLEGKRHYAHAISRLYERAGRLEKSMTWLETGKQLLRSRVPDRVAEDAACFDKTKALTDRLRISDEVSGEGSVFVVGLPRTGTTLTERILGAHSLMTTAGERPEFAAVLAEQIPGANPNVVDQELIRNAAQIDLKKAGERYRSHLRAITQGADRFTDKMPSNFYLVPAILSALPDARVIAVRRNPMDSVLSLYRQFLAGALSHYHFALSLTGTAHAVARYHALVKTLEQRLPKARFTVVDYENLVSETESEVRRLFAFAGLDFEPASLDLTRNQAPVATASVVQVRQPVSNSSVGRWKDYRDLMAPALAVLGDHGLSPDQ